MGHIWKVLEWCSDFGRLDLLGMLEPPTIEDSRARGLTSL
jgi:hypothetical protein